jgi:hypothetical protein
MRLNAWCEVVNNLATTKGIKNAKNRSYYSQMLIGNDQNSYYFFLKDTKKPVSDKYKVII